MNIGQDIKYAKTLLEQGELVAIPTETVYGLAANGLDPDAVLKIYKAKDRPAFNPLILHMASMEEAKTLTSHFPKKAELLANAYWPGPLTLVLPKHPKVPDITTAGLPSVALRIPDHPLTLQLLRHVSFPLAAPSANPSGYISPTTAAHVAKQLGNKVAYILDGGPCRVGIESTIVKIEETLPVILRLGGLSVEHIEKVAGRAKIASPQENPESPGMLSIHYAPAIPLILDQHIEDQLHRFKDKKTGILSFQKDYSGHPQVIAAFTLSPTGNLEEAARNIFSYMRQLDELQPDIILAEPVPDEGLGKAINDRLRRAAARQR